MAEVPTLETERMWERPVCLADAEQVLNAGAEKISVNSPALRDPDLIDRLSARYGAQCVVVGVDSVISRLNCPVAPLASEPVDPSTMVCCVEGQLPLLTV